MSALEKTITFTHTLAKLELISIGFYLNKPAAQAAGADPPPMKLHQ